MKRVLLIALCCFCFFVFSKNGFTQSSRLGDGLVAIRKSISQAMNAQSLESLQMYARKTMQAADEFQRAAESVNDNGFVNQAVDIYTYAQRAVMSSTLPEARQYLQRAESYVQFTSDQSTRIAPDPEPEVFYHDYDDVSYRNYYDHNFDVDFESSQ